MKKETLFEIVKQGVSNREAAVLYGVDVNRTGMAHCPFHPDKHPSLYVAEDHYHCYGCGDHGDVIDFTAKLFGICGKSASRKLARDFGLNPTLPPTVILPFPKTPEMEQRDLERKCITALKDRVDALNEWHQRYVPKEPGEDYDSRFTQSCHELPTAQHLLDILLTGGEAEREKVVELLMQDGRLFRKEAA